MQQIKVANSVQILAIFRESVENSILNKDFEFENFKVAVISKKMEDQSNKTICTEILVKFYVNISLSRSINTVPIRI